MSMGDLSTGVLAIVMAALVFLAVRKVVRNFSSGSCGCHDSDATGCGGGCQSCAARAHKTAQK